MVLDSRTLRSTPETGQRADYDGAKRKRGSKLHMAVDTLGHLLALHVTPADADDRAEVGGLAEAMQAATGGSVKLAYSLPPRRRGSTRATELALAKAGGDKPAAAAEKQGIRLEMVKLPEAKRGFVLIPRRWATRFGCLVKGYEGYASTLAGLHLVAFVCLILRRTALLATGP